MNEPEIYETLTRIFRDEFDDEALTISEATRAADIDGWDSNRHIQILAAVEAKFGVKIHAGEIEAMKSVGDMVRLIQKKHRP